jgi:CHAT domain-containing protein
VIFNLSHEYVGLAKLFAERFELNLYHLPYRSYIKESRNSEIEYYDVICAVCHGYYDSADVCNSGLLLEKDFGINYRNIFLHKGVFHLFRDFPFRDVPTDIRTTHDAEILTMNELKVYCYIRAQLVALFGCSTGAGTTHGSSFDSFAYQWLKIGASSTLANLWESDFEFAKIWSTQFLTNWLEKVSTLKTTVNIKVTEIS